MNYLSFYSITLALDNYVHPTIEILFYFNGLDKMSFGCYNV